MGILMGALAGAGKAAGEIADQNTRRWDQQALADQNAQLEMAKMKMADEMRNNSVIAAEKRAEEPLKRFGGILQGNQNAMITTPGAAPDASAYEGIKIEGWSKGGDIETALKSAQSIKDPQARKEALDQIQSQINAQGDAIRSSVQPVTRKVTSEEALQKTREDSLASDPVALAAYEKSIGKSMRDDRRLDSQDAKASAQMDFNNRRLTSQDIKNEQQADFNNRRLEKLDQLQEYKSQAEDARNARLEGKQDTAMQRAELNSRRQSVVELMKSTEHEIERTMTLAGSALDPAAAKGFQDRVTRLTKDLTAYRSALETFSDGAIPPREKDAVQEPFPRGTVKDGNDGKFVYQGGDVTKKESWKPVEKTKSGILSSETTPAYQPPANSPAAKIIADREASTKSTIAARDKKSQEDAQRKTADEDAQKKAAEEYRARNNLKN